MGLFSKLLNRSDARNKPALTEDELIAKLNDCRERGLPVHHRSHGELRVTRVLDDCFFADSDIREDLMFPYKYFSDGLLSLPDEAGEAKGKTDGGAW